ncbi:MAG: hypothetical protein MK135_08645, partial [Polyangiaceae bacterium]|nr:hypothetical protein [Polyangiaceae bacterium]
MAKQTRKFQRAKSKEGASTGKELRAQMKQPPASASAGQAAAMPDPFAPAQIRSTALRVSMILLALWIIGGLSAGFVQSDTVRYSILGVTGALTVVVIGVLLWTLKRTKTAHEMAGLLQGVDTPEEREAAIAQLKTDGKKGDATKLFARAQL